MSESTKNTNQVVEFFKQLPLVDAKDHPSTDDVLNKEGASFTLSGKTILVTGASAGIGVETVRAFASKGAKVFVAVRDIEKTKKALAEIATAHPNNGGLEIIELDLSSLESIKTGAEDFLRRSSQLNILVNNAGVTGIPYQLTKDGHEFQFGVNHLGHFLLFKKLLPLLLKSSTPEFQSRVVALSSLGHKRANVDLEDLHWKKRTYDTAVSYGQSKTANILFAYQVERLYGDKGLHAWSVHPGVIATELARHLTPDYLVQVGLSDKDGNSTNNFKRKSLSQGAATTVWAAVSKELEGKGGLYLEDVKISEPASGGRSGHAPFAYNDEMASKLWEYSEEAVKTFL